MTTMTLDRTQSRFSNTRLMDVFDQYKQAYGQDVGLALCAMNLELVERVIRLEERVVKLEAKRR